jgi:DHA1 family bicyclomycin/chloramphenicol resistance-like MFS transporter
MPDGATLRLGALLTALVALGPISTDMYLPALPTLGRAFAADPAQVQLTLSMFLAGFACAQLVYGPLSDRFGRRWVIFGGLCLYLVATAACALAQTIDQLIAARFAQAVGACAGPVLGRAVVRDLFGRAQAAKMLAYMGTAMGLIPALAPILGGYLTLWYGWRSNFVVLTAVAVILILAVLAILRETNPHRDPTATQAGRLVRNYASLFRHRLYLGYVLAAAGTYGGLFAFLAGSSFVLIDFLGVAIEDYGLYFAIIVVGYMIGTVLVARLTPRFGLDVMVLAGLVTGAAAGAVGFVLAAFGSDHVASIIAPQFVYMIGLGIVLPNAIAGAIAPFPRMAGVASALFGFAQMGLAALAGIAAGAFHDGTQTPMVTAILVMAMAALAGYLLLSWPVRGEAGTAAS